MRGRIVVGRHEHAFACAASERPKRFYMLSPAPVGLLAALAFSLNAHHLLFGRPPLECLFTSAPILGLTTSLLNPTIARLNKKAGLPAPSRTERFGKNKLRIDI